jgi:hypothetical protein
MEKTVPKIKSAGNVARAIVSRGVGRNGGVRVGDVVADEAAMLTSKLSSSGDVLTPRRVVTIF